ncbi:unnamed protein product, partial [Rotaria sp. Silwood2]
MVSTEDGRQLTKQIKVDVYMEYSAKTREGIQELFIRATCFALEKRRNRRERP